MQKIQFYLVPNRITVTTDMAGFTTEYRQVYQRTIKLHKGIDNTIELEVKNSDQRRQDVNGWTAIIKFFDAARVNLFTAVGTPIIGKPGLISATISSQTLEKIDPQMLTAAAFLTDGQQDKILYSDSQFDVLAHVQILDAYNEVSDVVEEVTRFNWEYGTKEYVSEIANFGFKINNDYSTAPTRTATFSYEGLYDGVIRIEATNDKSTAIGNTWDTLAVWDTAVEETKTVTGDYRYVRFRIVRDRSLVRGTGARFTVGKSGGLYTSVVAVLRGQDYQVGDTFTIKGSLLGGSDGANDLMITVTGVTNGVSSQGNIDTISWAGSATTGTDSFESIGVEPVSRLPNPVDKIIIRD